MIRLTLPQEDVYFEQLLYPDDPIYNIGAKISIEGKLEVDLLKEAYRLLIDQHDAYRCILNDSGAAPQMEVLPTHHSQLEVLDFSTKNNADEQATAFMQNTFQEPFDLRAGQLLHRFILIKISDTHHYLFSVYHHIITDGWGTSLMFQRLVQNYNELLNEGALSSEYPYSYRDFVENDAAYYLSEDYQKDKTYWTRLFAELPERLLEKKFAKEKANQSKRKVVYIKREVYDQLSQVGKKAGGSTFHIILAILFLYFSKRHQNQDFAIGLPVLNRTKSVFKRTVGLFMGISPLRIQLDLNDTFGALVKNIRQTLRQNYRHQRFPLGKLIKSLELYQDKDRLFNITLSYEKQNYADHFANTKTQVIPLSHHSERVALAIYIREFDESEDVKIDFDYNVNYFDEEAIERVTVHFQNLLSEVIKNIDQDLEQYEYLNEEEKKELLFDFNQTEFDYPADATFLGFFQDQLNQQPDKIALVDQDKNYSYRDLDHLSNTICDGLSATQKEQANSDLGTVAVLMNRSADMVAVLLGILKSGRAFIPLDPLFPKERLEYIIQHSKVQQIISTERLKTQFQFPQAVKTLKSLVENSQPPSTTDRPVVTPQHTAYVIYTSGSTGKPKGVQISHGALLNFLLSMQHRPGLQAEDYLFSVTTPSFDIAILEFFTPLLTGAKVYLASPDLLSDPLSIVQALEVQQPSVIQATPSFYQMLYNAAWQGNPNLKILCGGDLLSETLAERLLATNREVWNMYGPTETTIWSTCKRLTKAEEASIIGTPIYNTYCYILDDQRRLLPRGSVGTLYLGGDGLAQGYYHEPKLTTERFVTNPFRESEKMYNTGDLAQWNSDGEIKFLGRNDLQVKIRGYRIELGEIETRLNEMPEIQSSVVVAQKKMHQEAILIAYVTWTGEALNPSIIAKRLRGILPEYMLPAVFIGLDEFPLTPNKKVDRKTLAARNWQEQTTQFKIAPSTDLEHRLCGFFREVLDLEKDLSITDNFFRLGGHSLNAVKLINLINEQLDYQLTLKNVFDHPSVEELARYLGQKEKQTSETILPVEPQEFYPLSPAQYNLWLAAQQEGRAIAYNMPAVFRINGEIDRLPLEKAFQMILEKYEILRASFVELGGTPRLRYRAFAEVDFTIAEYTVEQSGYASIVDTFQHQVFDLEKDTLLKIALIYAEDKPTYLMFNTHHVIMDGWALGVMVREIVELYRALVKKEKLVADLSFQFKDYVGWHQKQASLAAGKNGAFWRNYLDQYTWQNNIPFDHEFPVEEGRATTIEFNYSTINIEQLNQSIQDCQTSVHSYLLATFTLLLYRMYGADDICIGTLNSGRTRPDLESQLGMFVKTLPLRTQVNPKWNLKEMIQHTHSNILQINEYQDLPGLLQQTLRLDTIMMIENPLVDYHHIDLGDKTQLVLQPLHSKYSRLPLLVRINLRGKNLAGAIEFDPAYYDSATIELLHLKWEQLLLASIEDVKQGIDQIDIDLAIEKEQTLDIDFDF